MIVPMKKAKLFFMDEAKKDVVKLIQLHGLLMIDERHQQPLNPSIELVKTKKAIEVLEKHVKKASFGNNSEVTTDEFNLMNYETLDNIEGVLNMYEKLTLHKDELRKLTKERNKIFPYKDFSLATKTISTLRYLNVVVGKISNDKVEPLLGHIQSLDIQHEIINESDYETYIAFAVLKEDNEKLMNTLNNMSFSVESLKSYDHLNADVIKKLDEDVKTETEKISNLDNELTSLTNFLFEFKIFHDQLLNLDIRNQVTFENTEETLYLEGWLRSDQVALLEELLKSNEIVYELELRNPLDEELSPTALKNNAFVQPFENITNQFSVPNPKELDPNPLMSFWYWIIFGIMMGDMGYGLVMMILFGLVYKFGKLKGGVKDLVKVFALTGITAFIVGITFGSLFGEEIFTPLLNPIEDPVTLLIISIGIGIVHIISGLIMKLIISIRNKDVLGGLSDAVSWILILSGLSVYASTLALSFEPMILNIINYISIGMIGIGLLLIVLFNGRHQKSIPGKIVSALGGLYSSTGYLSDVLSYSRILALALSSGVIAMTFNILGNMVWNSVPVLGIVLGIIVFLIGHIFNFVMGLLSAYVHAGRLQYLEFYGKFYEGGGYLFNPLQLELKYIYQVNLKKKNN